MARVLYLTAIFPVTWLMMLFASTLETHMSYVEMLPLGAVLTILTGALVSVSSVGVDVVDSSARDEPPVWAGDLWGYTNDID